MKCAECEFEYPEEILAPMHTSEGTTGLVCGICALELGNKITGIKRTEFAGPKAEALRQAALKVRAEKQ